MPLYRITVINEEFRSCEEQKCSDRESARQHAVGAALAIGAEQVKSGRPFFGAQVVIEEDGEVLAQYIVAAGASPLKG